MDSQVQYSIKFEIVHTVNNVDGIDVFHGEEISTDIYHPTITWDTKFEAIDACIHALEKIKKEQQNDCEHYFITDTPPLTLAGGKVVTAMPEKLINRCRLCGVHE